MLQIALEPTRGVEPPTHGLQNRCSTIELRRQAPTHRHEYSSFTTVMQPLRLAEVCGIGKVPDVRASKGLTPRHVFPYLSPLPRSWATKSVTPLEGNP